MRVTFVLTGLVAEIALTALFPYVAGQRITSQEQRSPSNNHEEINCKVPGTNGTYSPWNGKYCVYALGYTELAYEKDIFYNDKTKSYARDVDVVTVATCWQDELLKTKYSGGLLRIAGRSVNLFFACCKRCEEFDSPKDEILLKLKNVFTAYSVLNMKKIYDVVVGENSRENVMYRERYLVRLNKGGIMERIELPTCLSEGFRLAPSLIYTPICWVKTNWKGHCEICGDKADKQYLNIEASGKLNSKFGPFDAYRVHAMEETYCSNFFDKTEDFCGYWDTHREYNVECCCYGNITDRMLCQSNLMKTAGDVDNKRGICAARTFFSHDGQKTMESVAADIKEYSNDREYMRAYSNESLKTLRPLLLATKYCATHLCYVPWRKFPFVYLHEQRQLSLRTVNLSSLAEAIPTCEQLFIDDYRLRDIYRIQCYPGFPLDRMCPFDHAIDSEMTTPSSIVCCCDDEAFCNHKGDMRARTVYKPKRLCQNNNDYQQLFNKHVINDSIMYHSCLVHYANEEVMRQLLPAQSRSKAMVLNVLPGAPLIPIDYSYAFLNDSNSCGYIEAVVNWRYVASRQCRNEAKLNEEFLPLKLYVCRCRTVITGGVVSEPCDMQLKVTIGKIEAAEENNISNSICALYTATSQQEMLEAKLIQANNRMSGVCQITVSLSNKGGRYKISGGFANNAHANKARIPLNHIAYAMLERTGDRSDLCASTDHETICFCRSYEHGVACNADMQRMKSALHAAYTSKLRASRFEHRIMLMPDETAFQETCSHEGSVAVIQYDAVHEEVMITANCLYGHGRIGHDGIVCRQRLRIGKRCVQRNGRVICCCIRRKICEQMESQIANIINAADKNKVID